MSESALKLDKQIQTSEQMPWIRLAIIAALFIWLHWIALVRIELFARLNPSWSHAYLIPFISLIMLYRQRDNLASNPSKTWWPGLGLFLCTTTLFFIAFYPLYSTMLLGYTMVLNLCALIIWLNGWQRAKYLLPAAGYLAFAVKIDAFLWDTISWELQCFAAWLSHVLINVSGLAFGIQSKLAGTQIIILWQEGSGYTQGAMNVAESCSGLQYLIAFMALGVAIAYFSHKAMWIRLTLISLTIPVAIFVNVLRVTIQGLLYPAWPDLMHGDAHMFIGMLMLLPAVLIFLLLAKLLDKLIIEVPSKEQTSA